MQLSTTTSGNIELNPAGYTDLLAGSIYMNGTEFLTQAGEIKNCTKATIDSINIDGDTVQATTSLILNAVSGTVKVNRVSSPTVYFQEGGVDKIDGADF